jgi:hypothetical protein
VGPRRRKTSSLSCSITGGGMESGVYKPGNPAGGIKELALSPSSNVCPSSVVCVPVCVIFGVLFFNHILVANLAHS